MKFQKRLNNFKVFCFLLIFVLCGCRNQTSTEWKNYQDIIKVNDYYYVVAENSIDTENVGEEIGEVKTVTPKADGKYEYENFEASKLDVGTKIYSSKKSENQVIIKDGSNYKAYEKKTKTVIDDLFED